MSDRTNSIIPNISIRYNNQKTLLSNNTSIKKIGYNLIPQKQNRLVDVNKDDAFSLMLSTTESFLYTGDIVMKKKMSTFLTRVLKATIEEKGRQQLKAWSEAVDTIINGQKNADGSRSGGIMGIKKMENSPFFLKNIEEVFGWISAVKNVIGVVRLSQDMSSKTKISFFSSPIKLSNFLNNKISSMELNDEKISFSEDDFRELSVFVFRKWVKRYVYGTEVIKKDILSFCDSPSDLMKAILHGIHHPGSNPALMDCIDVTWA